MARVQTVLEALNDRLDCVLIVILAGSAALLRYGDVEADVKRCAPLAACLTTAPMEPHGTTASAAYTGMLTTELATMFRDTEPDTVVVIADRYETIATSIAASYQGIEVCHLLGGERSGNIDDKVRFANTALADVHCVATKQAYKTLDMITSLHGEHVHVTGCPSVDLALRAHFPDGGVLNATGVGAPFDVTMPYVVGMYHPCEEDTFTPAELFHTALEATESKGYQLLWFWPNIDPGAEAIEKTLRLAHEGYAHAKVRLYRHLPAEHFLGLLTRAAALIGNSSVGVREAGALGLPVINVGARQKGRLVDKNCVSVRDIRNCLPARISAALACPRFPPSELYGTGDAGERIANILCTP